MSATTHHVIKCDTEYFDAVAAGRKTFEVRYNDRGYQAGDTVSLIPWDREAHCRVSDRVPLAFRIGYVFPLSNGTHVVFSLLPLEIEP